MGRARVALRIGGTARSAERCSSHSACRTFASPTCPLASTRWSSRRCRSRRLERGDQPPPPPPEGPGVAAVPAGGLRFEYLFTRFEPLVVSVGGGPLRPPRREGAGTPRGRSARGPVASAAGTPDRPPGPLRRPADGRVAVLQGRARAKPGGRRWARQMAPRNSTACRRRAGSCRGGSAWSAAASPAGRSPSASRPPPRLAPTPESSAATSMPSRRSWVSGSGPCGTAPAPSPAWRRPRSARRLEEPRQPRAGGRRASARRPPPLTFCIVAALPVSSLSQFATATPPRCACPARDDPGRGTRVSSTGLRARSTGERAGLSSLRTSGELLDGLQVALVGLPEPAVGVDARGPVPLLAAWAAAASRSAWWTCSHEMATRSARSRSSGEAGASSRLNSSSLRRDGLLDEQVGARRPGRAAPSRRAGPGRRPAARPRGCASRKPCSSSSTAGSPRSARASSSPTSSAAALPSPALSVVLRHRLSSSTRRGVGGTRRPPGPPSPAGRPPRGGLPGGRRPRPGGRPRPARRPGRHAAPTGAPRPRPRPARRPGRCPRTARHPAADPRAGVVEAAPPPRFPRHRLDLLVRPDRPTTHRSSHDPGPCQTARRPALGSRSPGACPPRAGGGRGQVGGGGLRAGRCVRLLAPPRQGTRSSRSEAASSLPAGENRAASICSYSNGAAFRPFEVPASTVRFTSRGPPRRPSRPTRRREQGARRGNGRVDRRRDANRRPRRVRPHSPTRGGRCPAQPDPPSGRQKRRRRPRRRRQAAARA